MLFHTAERNTTGRERRKGVGQHRDLNESSHDVMEADISEVFLYTAELSGHVDVPHPNASHLCLVNHREIKVFMGCTFILYYVLICRILTIAKHSELKCFAQNVKESVFL